jgi:hypothetical protein
MNNFKDYNNMSLNMQDNAYAMFLRQQELNKILLEKKLAKEKKGEKKADKDYDGDGEVETGSEEFLGSRDKAIKANMAKKNNKSKKPAKKVEKKKKHLKEGTEVQAGNFVYGGFPKILNEVEIRLAKGNANPDEESELAGRPDPHATDGFNDANDGPGKPSVATQSDSEEESLEAMEKRHAEMIAANIGIERDYDEPGERRGLGQRAREKLYGPANALRAKIEAHPEFIARREAAMPNQFPPPFIRTPETEERKMGRRIG